MRHSFIGFSLILLIGGIGLLSIEMANGIPQSCAKCANNNNQNVPSSPQQNDVNNGAGNEAPPSAGNAVGQCEPSSPFDQANGCTHGAHFDRDSQSCVSPPSNCQQNENVNGNANGSGNQSGNANQNANANKNQNQNANQNANSNSNANRNQNANANSNSADNTNNNLNNNNINLGTRTGGK